MSKEIYIAVISLSLLSVISTIIGIFLAFVFKKSPKRIAIAIGFSVGIMLIISLFELIPEAIKQSNLLSACVALIFGALFIGLLNLFIPHEHHIGKEGRLNWQIRTAYLVAIGLILHDFPEGFAMATGYVASAKLGILIAISIIAHNIPEEFVMAVPLVIMGKKKELVRLGLLSALAEPLGAVGGLLAVSLFMALNPFLLAFAAGAMIFISLHELYPVARSCRQPIRFLIGAFISILFYLLLNFII